MRPASSAPHPALPFCRLPRVPFKGGPHILALFVILFRFPINSVNDGIGGVDFFQPLFGSFVAAIPVGMQRKSQLMIGFANLGKGSPGRAKLLPRGKERLEPADMRKTLFRRKPIGHGPFENGANIVPRSPGSSPSCAQA